ncbi:hypothetical protein MIR68_011568 [Amoeboaphelidium protococcarum]|nr:hypothetical protein MIR68_011568 [Amoeboaphelidium protococcarum]
MFIYLRQNSQKFVNTGIAVGLSVALGGCTYKTLHQKQLHDSNYISREQVQQHNSLDKGGIWVTYGSSVYDITKFVQSHPGGNRIMLAAGGPVEPYWKVYTIHDKPEVRQILEEYKIGELDPRDVADQSKQKKQQELDVQDPFSGDPERSVLLKVQSWKPFNAETPLTLIGEEFITPCELFYKRNHLPVPHITDLDDYKLTVESDDGSMPPQVIKLDDIKAKVASCQDHVTLQCAGNRRRDMQVSGALQGLLWEGGAIGNAEWTGVRLTDLLHHLYPQLSLSDLCRKYKHVQFEGLDGYGASVPVQKALNEGGDVYVVWQMNGQDLLPDHGYPLRVLIPGHVAARSVKWLSKIVLSQEESKSHWQRNDYKSFNPSSDWNNLKWADAKSIQEMPVQSAIASHQNNQIIQLSRGLVEDANNDESITVKGYAWSGGGRGIIRVDISPDGGKSWQEASLQDRPQQEDGKVWAWTLWEAQIDLKSLNQPSELQLVCKAVDSSYNSQPETSNGIYNKRGVLNNSWNRINIKIQ